MLGTIKRGLFVLTLLICSGAGAQDAVTSLANKVSGSQVSIGYLYFAGDGGKVKLSGNGHVVISGPLYFMEGDGLKVWCDGKERWTVDEAAKEVVVENASEDDFLSSPVLMVSRLPELFSWEKVGEKTLFNKKISIEGNGVDIAATRYSLLPKDGVESDFSTISLYFDSASALLGAEAGFKDGTAASFTVLSMSFIPAGSSGFADLSSLAFAEASFDSSYIITDLR